MNADENNKTELVTKDIGQNLSRLVFSFCSVISVAIRF